MIPAAIAAKDSHPLRWTLLLALACFSASACLAQQEGAPLPPPSSSDDATPSAQQADAQADTQSEAQTDAQAEAPEPSCPPDAVNGCPAAETGSSVPSSWATPAHTPSSGGAAMPVAVLNGGSPVYLSGQQAHSFRYSLASSTGYDSAVNDVPHLSGGITSMDAYFGALLRHRRFDLLLQEDANFTQSFGTGLGLQKYLHTTAAFGGVRGRNTSWTLSLENGYGSDSARAVGNVNSAILGTVAVPHADVTALGLTTGKVLSADATFAVDHQLSATRTLDLGLGSSYHHFFQDGASNAQYTVFGRYREQLSLRNSLGLYTVLARQNYIAAHCTTESVGMLASSRLSRSTQLEASAGPVFGTSLCAGGANYQFNASLTTGLPRTATLYLGGGRKRSDGLVQEATWENSAFAGIAAGQERHTRIRVDGGYATYKLVVPAHADSGVHGIFLSAEVHHRLNGALELSLTARRLTRSPDTAQLNRNLVLLTLSWRPVQHVSREIVLEGDDGLH